MSTKILKCILKLFKYQFLGIKSSANSGVYNLLTFEPIHGVFDLFSMCILIFYTFIGLPFSILFNLACLFIVWVINPSDYEMRKYEMELKYSEFAYQMEKEYKYYESLLKKF